MVGNSFVRGLARCPCPLLMNPQFSMNVCHLTSLSKVKTSSSHIWSQSFIKNSQTLVPGHQLNNLHRSLVQYQYNQHRVLHNSLKHPVAEITNLCHKAKAGFLHSYHWIENGFRLFGVNARISLLLIKKKIKGHPLSYREHKLLVQTLADVFKLIPFSFFIIVPFAEVLIPAVIWLFPRFLPSTFSTRQADDSYLRNRLVAIQELTQFFQELVAERTKQISEKPHATTHSERALILERFHESLLKKAVIEQQQQQATDVQNLPKQSEQFANPFLSLEETLKFAKLFREEFRLENLSTEILTVMCRMLDLEPYRMRLSILLQLRHHILKLQKEDREILWEGVESLSHHELVEACKDRAMRFYGVSDDTLREQLSTWLRLSSQREISPVLLLWSRSITMTHSHELETTNQDDIPSTSAEDLLPVVEDIAEDSIKSDISASEHQQAPDNFDDRIRRLNAAAELLKISEKRHFDAQKILNALFSSDDPTSEQLPISENKNDLNKALQTSQAENRLWRQIFAKQHILNSETAEQLSNIIFRYSLHIPPKDLTYGQELLLRCVSDLETMLSICESEAKDISNALEESKS